MHWTGDGQTKNTKFCLGTLVARQQITQWDFDSLMSWWWAKEAGSYIRKGLSVTNNFRETGELGTCVRAYVCLISELERKPCAAMENFHIPADFTNPQEY